jgi:hypothetical protein
MADFRFSGAFATAGLKLALFIFFVPCGAAVFDLLAPLMFLLRSLPQLCFGCIFYFLRPLCGAALTSFSAPKEVSRKRRFHTTNPKCPSTA